MRIHTSKSSRLFDAALSRSIQRGGVESQVYIDYSQEHRSNVRNRAFEIHLGADYKVKTTRRAPNPGTNAYHVPKEEFAAYAATFDEWGWFLTELFDLDPEAVASQYKGRDSFHERTQNRYRYRQTVGADND